MGLVVLFQLGFGLDRLRSSHQGPRAVGVEVGRALEAPDRVRLAPRGREVQEVGAPLVAPLGLEVDPATVRGPVGVRGVDPTSAQPSVLAGFQIHPPDMVDPVVLLLPDRLELIEQVSTVRGERRASGALDPVVVLGLDGPGFLSFESRGRQDDQRKGEEETGHGRVPGRECVGIVRATIER